MRNQITKIYLFLVLVSLPMDWFSITGNLFREFGAKPAAPLLVCGAIVILILRPSTILKLSKPIFDVAVLLAAIFLFGLTAFLLNVVFAWSSFHESKNPGFQFFAQTALFVGFAFVLIIHALFFEDCKWRSYVVRLLPTVIAVHFGVFLLEATGAVSHSSGWLSFFRTVGSSGIERPSGLMSEPSYFGAFAALYGLPLLAIGSQRLPWRWILAGMLFGGAILIRAKTFVPVVLAECVALIWRHGRSAVRFRYVLAAIALLVVSVFLIVSNAALDLGDNLSSAMRIGSTGLAFRVAGEGYGLTGVGFGQFHFFYNEKYATHFLFASDEAMMLMSGGAEFRASTYNLFARLLVETGICGMALFVFLLYRATHAVRQSSDLSALFGLLLVAGSAGFLCTQDSYFYPPLAIGLALVLGCAADPENRIAVTGFGSTLHAR